MPYRVNLKHLGFFRSLGFETISHHTFEHPSGIQHKCKYWVAGEDFEAGDWVVMDDTGCLVKVKAKLKQIN